MILIEADILIDVLRRHSPAVKWYTGFGQPLSVVGYAAMELIQGCRDLDTLLKTKDLLRRHDLVWPKLVDRRRAVERFGELRLRFGLDLLDALIAETAIGLGQPLYTFNTRHFAAYSELSTIQPYHRA